MSIKTYEVNGIPVKVWTDYENCLKCGRKLTSRYSRESGLGPECRRDKSNSARVVLIIGQLPLAEWMPDNRFAVIRLVEAEKA